MINRFIAVGNLVKKPEFKSLPSGHMIAEFSIAQSEKTKRGENSYFFNCVIFGKQAEFISKYGEKGRKIYLEGSYKPEKYVNKEGGNSYSHKIQVSGFQFLDFQKTENIEAVENTTQQTQAPFFQDVNSIFTEDDIPF